MILHLHCQDQKQGFLPSLKSARQMVSGNTIAFNILIFECSCVMRENLELLVFLLDIVAWLAARPVISHGFLLASQTNTPRFTPPGSPPSQSASVSPTRTSKPVSPRRHSLSFATSRGMFDDRPSFSSGYSSHYGSGSETGSQSGKYEVV